MPIQEPTRTDEEQLRRLVRFGSHELEVVFKAPTSTEAIIGALREIEKLPDLKDDMKLVVHHGKLELSPVLLGMGGLYEDLNVVLIPSVREPFMAVGKEFASIRIRNILGGPGMERNRLYSNDNGEDMVRIVARELNERLG